MLSIRLSRQGAKKHPFYQITVAERSARRDGRFLERLGFFEPVASGQSRRLRVDLERADYWLARGARPTERVRHLLKEARKDPSAQAQAPSETEAAAGGEDEEAAA